MLQTLQFPQVHPNIPQIARRQRTLASEISFAGIGIHTGSTVKMKFVPAPVGSGIQFRRVDLPGKPVIPATIEYVCATARSTTIGIGNVQIHTIEHVLAAVRAFNIDNLCIELTSHEPPVGNGSSDIFVEMIESAGVIEQDGEVPIVKLQNPVYWSEGDIHIVAIPSDTFRISYTLDYPESPAIKSQYRSFEIDSKTFKEQIAPCRTFSLYEEVSYLIDKGLIKGGSLDNAVIIKGEAIFSKGGLFFPDEMVRHKILDMIGDLSLIGFHFLAHVISIRSGHASNCAFARKMFNYITTEKPDGNQR